jgi:hypothetical protein
VLLLILPRGIANVLLITAGTSATLYVLYRTFNKSSFERIWRFSRLYLALACSFVSVMLMVWSAYVLSNPGNRSVLNLAGLLILSGGMILGSAIYITPFRLSFPALESSSFVFYRLTRINYGMLFIGIISLLLLAEINGAILALPILSHVSVHLQMLLLLNGIIGITFGLGGTYFNNFWPVLTRKKLWALTGIILLSFIVRLWWLDGALHLPIDEGHYITAVNRLNNGESIQLLAPFSHVTAFTWLFPYVQHHAVNLLGPSLGSLRIPSVIAGVLTVLATYCLGRNLLDRPTALIAAFILAVFPPHVHFSRLGLNNIADPLFGTLSLAFFARALSQGHRLNYVLGGVFLGLTQYFHEAGRLLFPALTLVWLILIVPRRSKQQIYDVFSGLLVACLIAAPVYYTLIGQQTSLTIRMDTMNIGSERIEEIVSGIMGGTLSSENSNHLLNRFLVYIFLPEGSWFYSGNTPLILWYLAPAFLLGVFHLIWCLGKPAALLLLIWVIGTALGNALMGEIWFARYIVVFPALALIIAVGLRFTVALIGKVFAQHFGFPQIVQRFAVAVFVGVISVAQPLFYFNTHLPLYLENDNTILVDDALFRAALLPNKTHVHFIHDGAIWLSAMGSARHFWRRLDLSLDAIYPRQLNQAYLDNLIPDANHAFFLDPKDEVTLAVLRENFYLRPAEYSPFNIPQRRQMILYYAPYIPGYSEQLRGQAAMPTSPQSQSDNR